MNLNNELREIAFQFGASYFGVADLSTVQDILYEQGGQEVTGYPYSISIGITLIHAIVDSLPDKHKYSVALNYDQHAYKIVNNRLDLIASILSSRIQNKGYKVLPISAAERIDDDRIRASFSHKLGANLAGLGWIGKSCLLVTPENGPRVRWTSILTDAPLQASGSRVEVKCGDCVECVNICPAKAFSGRNFIEGEPRELRYDARKCEQHFEVMKDNGELPVCGLCLYICPFGRKQK